MRSDTASLPGANSRASAVSPPREKGRELPRFARRLCRNPLSLGGMLGIVLFVVIGLTASYWVPYPEHILTAPSIRERLQPPSAKHWFGTDNMGRDIFTRVMVGTGVSLRVTIVVVVLASTIGSVVGIVAGYVGGWLDAILMRVTDGFLAFPALVLALAIATSLGPSLLHGMMAITVVWWPWYARLVRSTALQIRNELFVEAARAIGGGTLHIMWRHILPNCFVPILVQASLDFGYVLLTASSLSFLGVAAQPPEAEWGLMVNTGRKFFPDWWWMPTFPGMAIFVAVFAFNLFGDGLRDVLDPRLSQSQ